MSTEIVKRVDDEILNQYLHGSNTKLTEEQKILFFNISKMFNLNPFKREVYAIPFEKNVKVGDTWKKETQMQVITGYQVYIDRATATGLLDGWNVKTIKSEKGIIIGAKIVIYRKDFKYPFEWEVFINEFAKVDRDGKYSSMWKTMPDFMIKKVAIGQGFRLAFPNELGGMPYLAEEPIYDDLDKENEIKKDEPDMPQTNIEGENGVPMLVPIKANSKPLVELLTSKFPNNTANVAKELCGKYNKTKTNELTADEIVAVIENINNMSEKELHQLAAL